MTSSFEFDCDDCGREVAAAVAQLVLERVEHGPFGPVLENQDGDHAGSAATVQIEIEDDLVLASSPSVDARHALGTIQDALRLLEGTSSGSNPGGRIDTTGFQEGSR